MLEQLIVGPALLTQPPSHVHVNKIRFLEVVLVEREDGENLLDHPEVLETGQIDYAVAFEDHVEDVGDERKALDQKLDVRWRTLL